MTLREFTKDCTANCKMETGTVEWRPTMRLRIKQQDYDGFFKKAERQLQQEWEGVHAGQVVFKEWRNIEFVNDYWEF